MRERRDVGLDDAVIEKLSATLDFSTRLAVVESNYASREFVVEVKWEIVKWLVGVAIGGLAVGASVAALIFRVVSS